MPAAPRLPLPILRLIGQMRPTDCALVTGNGRRCGHAFRYTSKHEPPLPAMECCAYCLQQWLAWLPQTVAQTVPSQLELTVPLTRSYGYLPLTVRVVMVQYRSEGAVRLSHDQGDTWSRVTRFPFADLDPYRSLGHPKLLADLGYPPGFLGLLDLLTAIDLLRRHHPDRLLEPHVARPWRNNQAPEPRLHVTGIATPTADGDAKASWRDDWDEGAATAIRVSLVTSVPLDRVPEQLREHIERLREPALLVGDASLTLSRHAARPTAAHGSMIAPLSHWKVRPPPVSASARRLVRPWDRWQAEAVSKQHGELYVMVTTLLTPEGCRHFN